MIKNIQFTNFKALEKFSIHLEDVNVIVGPNNAGKSTILDGLRALEGALRYAKRRIPRALKVDGFTQLIGYEIPEASIPITLANLTTNYNSNISKIEFKLNNGNKLLLQFSQDALPRLFVEVASGKAVHSTAVFAQQFPLNIVSIPTLSPFEEKEEIVDAKYVERNVGTRRGARLFRNFWFQNRVLFSRFKSLVEKTWKGVTIEFPERQGHAPPALSMYFKEGRIDREVYWSGFGFQVWLQFLTHLMRADKNTILVVDEPDIYLHPDLQHRLFELVSRTASQCLLATHSVEIINEADPTEIVVVDKSRFSAKRVKDIDGLQAAYHFIGSKENIRLARLSRDRKVLFVEGLDFRLLRRFASKLGLNALGQASDLAVIPLGGFGQRQRVEHAAWTFRTILDSDVQIAAVFDRDYRCDAEISDLEEQLKTAASPLIVLNRKEIENYLLDENAISSALILKLKERKSNAFSTDDGVRAFVRGVLLDVTESYKSTVMGQRIGSQVTWEQRSKERRRDYATIATEVSRWVDKHWVDLDARLRMTPGKLVLAEVFRLIQERCKASLSDITILKCLDKDRVDPEFRRFLTELDTFAATSPVAPS